jgi:hypothetical protein
MPKTNILRFSQISPVLVFYTLRRSKTARYTMYVDLDQSTQRFLILFL